MRFATRPVTALALMFVLAGAVRSEAAPFLYTFDASTQGWGGIFEAIGGNPGGFLEASNTTVTGPGSGQFTVNVAASYTGSLFGATDWDSTLSFDTRLVRATTTAYGFSSGFILLGGFNAGAPFTIALVLPNVPLTAAWTTLSVPLLSGVVDDVMHGVMMAPATQSLLQTYLPLVTSWTINDQYHVDRPNTATVAFGYDNIRLVGPTQEPPTSPVPEPATLSLLGLGMAGAAVRRYRQRRS